MARIKNALLKILWYNVIKVKQERFRLDVRKIFPCEDREIRGKGCQGSCAASSLGHFQAPAAQNLSSLG